MSGEVCIQVDVKVVRSDGAGEIQHVLATDLSLTHDLQVEKIQHNEEDDHMLLNIEGSLGCRLKIPQFSCTTQKYKIPSLCGGGGRNKQFQLKVVIFE